MNPLKFAHIFDREFRQNTLNLKANEIPLFRACQKTFLSLSKQFAIEEYHGSKAQVLFSGQGSWGRQKARCELADLMIVSFCQKPNISIRLTFLQAKSERKKVDFSAPTFKANLEQWDLLSRRPIIRGHGKFDPPPNLLSDALLPSVGTFGFFYQHNNSYQIYYSSANNLVPPKSPSQKHSKLSVQWVFPCQVPCMQRLCIKKCLMMHPKNNFAEIISAPCNIGFAYGLAANLIGTPIEITSGASQDSRNWLKRVLNGLIQEAVNQDRPPNIARELITMLDGDSEGNETSDSGVKSVVLIKTDRD